MLKAKSDKESEDFKYDGNVFYKRKELFNALICYNKSICFAESKEKLALAYANRSAVFFELKKYDECLLNIKWAKENKYPADKIQRLEEREQKCKQLMKFEDPEDDPMEFFKLSYPANPKIPFIVDCIEIRGSKKNRGIYAKKDLKAGDVVAIEEFAFKRMYCPGQYNRCCLCLKVNMMNLIPCLKYASMMYCSTDCRNKTYAYYGIDLEAMIVYASMLLDRDRLIKDFECAFGSREQLVTFLMKNDFEKLDQTIFDFDWNDETFLEQNKAICLLSMNAKSDAIFPLVILDSQFVLKRSDEYLKLLKHLQLILNTYGSEILYYNYEIAKQMCPQTVHDGIKTNLLGPLMKSSCMFNVACTSFENKAIYICEKPIKAGEELLIQSYPLYYHKSTAMSRSIYMLEKCDCYACVNNLKPSDFKCKDFKLLHEAKENSEIAHKNVKKTKAQMKENWKIITAYCNDPLSLEAAELIQENARMLLELAQKASFPCY